MTEPVWLLPEVIVAVHERLLADFGGPSGVRDAGLLDSALARPVNRYGYGDATIWDLAASYAFAIVRNHPFIDGNKRVGFAAAAMFLELNGRRVVAAEADVVIRTLALAAGEMTEEQYAAWLRQSCKPEGSRPAR